MCSLGLEKAMDSSVKEQSDGPGVLQTIATSSRIALCGTVALLCVMGFLISAQTRAAGEAQAPAPLIVREGERLKVPANSPLRTHLTVATVGEFAAPHSASFPGAVEADPALTVNVLPQLTGQLITLPVRLGDVVHANQVLAMIGSPDLAQAFSDADKARDALALAERTLARARGVNQAGANAAKDLEQAQSNEVQAAAELTRAETRLKNLGVADPTRERPHPLEVRAPVAGTITALNIGIGSFINDPTAAIMTISNLDTVWVTASVPESSLSGLTKGLPVEVTLPALPGVTLKGKVEFVSPILDPDTRRARARVAFRNTDGRLKPNMYANVTVALPQSGQPTVPSSALLMNNDNVSVFVEVEPWVFTRRVVEIGNEDGDAVRIVTGLHAGERIVVRGGVLLND
jgi:cobalt-zinc-cadmium efflux system membrane fusion protein